MKKRISPKDGLKIGGLRQRFVLLPCAALILLALGFVFVPYLEASLRASAAGSGQSPVNVDVSDAWASLQITQGHVVLTADNPAASGTIVSGVAKVVAATSAPSGYKLYLSASDTADGTTANMYNQEVTNVYSIRPHSSTPSAFDTVGTWGYAIVGDDAVEGFDSDYSGNLSTKLFRGAAHLDPLDPSSNTGLIAEADGPRNSGVETDIHYAAYVSSSLANGTYAADITYTLVADFLRDDSPADPVPGPSPAPAQPQQSPASYGSNHGGQSADDTLVTALGVNNMDTLDGSETIAGIANLNDGNITWAAIAIIAGASATFLAIALLRDRDEEDEEE